MKISRRGTYANHGTSSIELRDIFTSWNSKECVIELKAKKVADFNTNSTHSYTISIPLADIAKILNSLGLEGVSTSSNEIEPALCAELKALNRLIAAASGLISAQ